MTSAAAGFAWEQRGAKPMLARLASRAIERARRPLAACGIDVTRMRAIVETKLLLDARAQGTLHMPGAGLLLLMAMAWLSSLPIGIAAVVKLSPEMWIALVSAHGTMFLGFLLVAQLVPILVDSTDVAVIGALPVPDRTLFAARLAHLATYTILLALPTLFWPLFLGWIGFFYPWVLVAVPITVALSAANAIGGVALVFALVLRIVGPERFQRFAFWTQILGAVFVMGGWQILVHVLPVASLLELCERGSPLRFVLPPLQIGSALALLHGDTGRWNAVGAVLAVATPTALFGFALVFASRSFAAALASETARATVRARGFAKSVLQRAGDRLCASRAERAGFDLGLALGRRDRTFLRATLPALIGLLAPAVVNVLPRRASSKHEWLAFLGVIPIYLAAIIPPALVESMRLCETPEASWLFAASRQRSLRDVTRGVVKALIVALAVPVLAVLGAVLVAFSGLRGVPDALLAAALAFAIGVAAVPRMKLDVPFSGTFQPGDLRFDNLPPIFVTLLFAMLACGLHALVRLHWASHAAAGVLAAILAALAWRKLAAIREPNPLDPSERRARVAR